MKKVIINADDLGLAAGTNTGIIEAMTQGAISSTSLMTCGQAFDHAVQLLNQHQIRNVGVHLVLDEERPLLPADQLSTVVGTDGHFLTRGQLLKKLLFQRAIDMKQVKREFSAQIQKCLDVGITPTHLDGHGHVHVYPQINQVVAQLANEFRITKVRLPAERFFYFDKGHFNAKKYLNKCIVTVFALRSKPVFAKRGLVFPDSFMGMLFGGNLNEANLAKILSHMPPGPVVEIMSHPGQPDPALVQRYHHWQYNWTDEQQAMMGYTKTELASRHQLKAISFSEL